jgi:2-oxoisovalerate dehydrogenase E1 component alpha subunit
MAALDQAAQCPRTPFGVEDEPVQLVAPDGAATSEHRFRRHLPPETLSWLYESMVVTRELDTEFVNLQRQGELALFASCRGQEAAQVGAAGCLRKTDWLFPQYRELGALLIRGIAPAQLGAVWRGRWHGGLGFTDKCVAPLAIPIGTHGLHGVGAAMAAQRLGEDSVTVVFMGDGATSEGDAHEALNLASVFSAPCVFFVQNNQWAISVPLAKQIGATTLARRAAGYGMPGVRVDGNDVLACYAVMEEAATRARGGGGPTFIEAVTYRMGRTRRPTTPPGTATTRTWRSGAHGIPSTASAPICAVQVCGPSASRSASPTAASGCGPSCASR